MTHKTLELPDNPTDLSVLACYRKAMEIAERVNGYQGMPIETKADCERKSQTAEQAVEVAHYLNRLMDLYPRQYAFAVDVCDLEAWLCSRHYDFQCSRSMAAIAWVLLDFDCDTAAPWVDATHGSITPALAATLRIHDVQPDDPRLQKPHPVFSSTTWIEALVYGLDIVDGLLGE